MRLLAANAFSLKEMIEHADIIGCYPLRRCDKVGIGENHSFFLHVVQTIHDPLFFYLRMLKLIMQFLS